jgi:arylformamidase
MRTRPRWLAIAALCIAGAAACRSAPPLPRRVVDLSPPLTSDVDVRRLGSRTLRFLGTEGRLRVTPVLPQQSDHAFGVETIELLSHSGAHLDAPARLLRGGEPPARISLERLIGPARLADLRWHDRHTAFQISDLELVEITAGDVVILFAGYEPPRGDKWPAFAPLSRQASEYLVAKRIRALATDLPSIASFEQIEARLRNQQPPEEVWEEYLPLMQAQIPIIAGLVNLDALVDEKRVLFEAFPLPLADASGAPVRAAALIY